MRRTKAMRYVFMMLLLVLCGRLYYVQILCASELTAAAHNQQMIPVLQENCKGVIYDRNMQPLTGTEQAYYYLIHKENLNPGAARLLERMEAEQAGQKGDTYLAYRTNVYLASVSNVLQKQYKAYGFAVDVRYGEDQIAAALISDLDEIYAAYLQENHSFFSFIGNGAGGLIHGTGINRAEMTGDRSASLITTIDASLQTQVETMLEENGAAGCVMITDIATGQVLSMASQSPDAKQIVNLAVTQAYPLEKAYDFIKKTSKITELSVDDLAESLGLGQPVFNDYPEENSGVWDRKKSTLTAAQMSQLLMHLSNDGKKIPLTLVMSNQKEAHIPSMMLTDDTAGRMTALCRELAKKPLIGDGWAFGYSGPYAVVLHVDNINPETLYSRIVSCL